MRRLKRIAAVAAPLAATMALLVPSAPAATTAAGNVTVTGQGSINPPLTINPATVSVSFGGQVTGTITVNGTNVTFVNVTCNFTGGGAADSLATGSGNVTGTCGGTGVVTPPGGIGTVSASCALNYDRVGGVVHVHGTCNASATAGGTTVSGSFCARGEFSFTPTSNPVASYVLAGSVTVSPLGTPACALTI